MPDLELGKALTLWSARLAALLYCAGVLTMVRKTSRPSCVMLTAGLLLYLAHVWCAFEYFYQWSHSVALRETARQTLQLFGVNWGGGLYLNYLFTALWVGDCVASWLNRGWTGARPRLAMHGFLAFMVVNGTVVVWILRA